MAVRVNLGEMRHGTELLKRGFAKMQEGGVVMDCCHSKAGTRSKRLWSSFL
jgi:Pyridoxine biosynthesis enzyme